MDSLEVKYIGKFIGPHEITGVVVSDQKTPLGSYIFEATLKNGEVQLIPEKAAAFLITDEAKDFNFLRDRREFVMIPEIVKLIEEYDVPIEQIPHLVQMIAYELDNRFGRAANWLWTKNDDIYAPGFDAMSGKTVLMAEKVIAEIPQKNVPTE